MRLLLDTHIALWAVADDPRLTQAARNLIAAPANAVVISVVTLWEIAIKHALARGRPNDMPLSADQAFDYFTASGYELLPIAPEHVLTVETLPPLHGDPFDRMLIAQALAVPLRLLTHDERLGRYSDTVILV